MKQSGKYCPEMQILSYVDKQKCIVTVTYSECQRIYTQRITENDIAQSALKRKLTEFKY